MQLQNFKKIGVLGSILLGLALSAPVVAADDDSGDSERLTREERFQQADTDGDGQISDAERSVAKEKRRAKVLERFDADGDGTLNEVERKAAKEKRREKMVKRFDTDGDGELNENEREAAKAAKLKRCQKRAENMDV